jgi:hypothetical protein
MEICMNRAVGFLITAIVLPGALAGAAQRGGQRGGQRSANAEPSPPHDPHDLSGIWVRRGGVLTLSNDLPPFTPEGKKRFDSNKPSYGPRAIPPALGNDPMGNCDPSEYLASFFSRTTRAISSSFRFQAGYFRFLIGIMSIASSGRTGGNFHGILTQEC